MAILVSPGTSVSVVDESAYASPGTGTIPLIVLATRDNKTDPTGTEVDGIAKYTKPAYAGLVVPVSSQREITQFFGEAIFTEGEGQETSEYGLLAAYSYLGQGSQAYIVRADIDLAQLDVSYTEPTGPVTLGTYWFDIENSKYGIHTFNGSSWVRVSPMIEVNTSFVADPDYGSDYYPTTNAVNGEYLVAVVSDGQQNPILFYYKGIGGSWAILDQASTGVTFSAHYTAPSSPSTGDTWVKTTKPGNGVDLKIHVANANGEFMNVPVQGVEHTIHSSQYILQDGSNTSFLSSLINGYIQLTKNSNGFVINSTNAAGSVVSLGGPVMLQADQPVGKPVHGQLWFDDTRTSLDILVRDTGGFWRRVDESQITYSTTAPSIGLAAGNIWVDTSAAERARPKLHTYVSGGGWVEHDNSDQSTESGVIFADFAYTKLGSTNITAVMPPSAPNAALYPAGMLAVNMALSKNTVRKYDASIDAWVNAAANHVDGSGAFGRLAQRNVIAVKMQAAVSANEDLRDRSRNFTLLVAPNFPELTDELVTLNADRGETGFIIVDTPMRKTPTEAVQWVQGVGAAENGDDGLVTKNTYSAVYYPPARSTTPAGVTVTVPASHVALYTYAYNDNIAYPWFAPAGLTRGMVQNGSAVGYITSEEEFKAVALNQGQRDAMYSNKLNPIATFPSEGVVVFGQKTLHPFASALDRVNVARLVAYLRERFEVIARPFIFEPNDEPTRTRAKAMFDAFLEDIVTKRGITDYVVQCDETNNTPLRIDRNELHISVAIEPTKSAEFLYIPIIIANTGSLSS